MKKLTEGILVVLVACVMALCIGCSSGSASSSASGSSTSAASTASASASASASSAAASGSAAASSSAGAVADGEHTIEVTLSGGSGKAKVESPARLVVSGGAMTATLVWSSSNYDKMVVDGVEYLPVNKSGNSTFEIPVTALDVEMPVQAETTAMSEPHMIDYTLKFDSSTLK